MKMKHINYLLILCVGAAFLSSCSNSHYSSHIRNRHMVGDLSFIKEKATPKHHLSRDLSAPEKAALITPSEIVQAPAEEELQTSLNTEPIIILPPAEYHSSPIKKPFQVQDRPERIKFLKEQKRHIRQVIKTGEKNTINVADAHMLVKIILAFLLPPAAVYIHEGIGTYFWLSIIFTLLFWVPGIIFALLVITDTI